MIKKVLLIADDDEMNRIIIKKFLNHSFDIIEAENGLQAMEIIRDMHVDALLLDIIMPEMDGLEVLGALRADDLYKDMGILIATSTKEKTERQALALGADDIVSKPYDPIVIQKRLENILLMKEVQIQKNMLQQEDIEIFLANQKRELLRQIEQSAKKFHNYADIIKYNEDNTRLLEEITESIHKEADAMVALVSDNISDNE